MAATVTIEERISIGGTDYLYLGFITMDNSYASGGEVIDATNGATTAGPAKFKKLIPAATAGYVPEFIGSSQKLKMFRQKDPAAAGGADIALPEVAGSVDLSAVVVPFIGVAA